MHHITACITIVASLFTSMPSATGIEAIQPNQAVRIQVANVPQQDRESINGEYPVSHHGLVNMPLLGRVKAAGLTAEQFAQQLEKAYIDAGIYTRPAFQVFANRIQAEPVQQVVHVGGQVRRTGPVPFANGLTIWQAIQAAGGETEFAEMRDVHLFRNGRVEILNLARNAEKHRGLRPGDTIEVPAKGLFRFRR
jgi:polysaccharide export outer membrane protein